VRRVSIIGPGGAGKSTLARVLGERTGLPVVHLDARYWRAGWSPTPPDEWRREVEALVAGPAWILDGNYGGTLDLRLAASDTVVFLDFARARCLWRVAARAWRHRGESRPDMAPGCPERLTREFVRWIWEYPRRRRPGVLRRLALLPPAVRVVRLRSPRAVAQWLREAAG
jgi:adenylate kinase family enzyme